MQLSTLWTYFFGPQSGEFVLNADSGDFVGISGDGVTFVLEQKDQGWARTRRRIVKPKKGKLTTVYAMDLAGAVVTFVVQPAALLRSRVFAAAGLQTRTLGSPVTLLARKRVEVGDGVAVTVAGGVASLLSHRVLRADDGLVAGVTTDDVVFSYNPPSREFILAKQRAADDEWLLTEAA